MAGRSRKPRQILRRLLLAGCVAAYFPAADAAANEVCRYTGETNYSGHVDISADVAASDGVTKIDVTVALEMKTLIWLRFQYLVEEISTWRGGELASVAVNFRSLINNHIVRQRWDEFRSGAAGWDGYRVQSKTLAEFRGKHPGFVRHWDPSAFGTPWLGDYPSASAERREDLDLPRVPLAPTLRPPLAMAFYWVRYLPADGQQVLVFLPGLGREHFVDLPITAAAWGSGTAWQALVRHPELSETPASTAMAWTSPDNHLQQLAYELHGPLGTATGVIHPAGCEGVPVVPAGR